MEKANILPVTSGQCSPEAALMLARHVASGIARLGDFEITNLVRAEGTTKPRHLSLIQGGVAERTPERFFFNRPKNGGVIHGHLRYRTKFTLL